MLRLLEKSEIDTLKVKDRDREQAEGLKLARRVDSLREIQAQEEKSLEEYRKKTLISIQNELKKESKPLEKLRKEVKELQEAKLEALKPLTEERDEITRVRAEMNEEKDILLDLKLNLQSKEEIIERRIKESKDEQFRAEVERNRSTQLLKDSDTKHYQAEKELRESERKNEQATSLLRITQEKSDKLKLDASIIGKRQENRDKDQDARELELNARETRLLDREQMLERNIKRLKQ